MTVQRTHRFERPAGVLPVGYLPDWGGVVERVRAVAASDGTGPRSAGLQELEREAFVLTFALFLESDEPGRAGATTMSTLRRLATVSGLREERARRAVEALARAGVICTPSGVPLEITAPGVTWDDTLAARVVDAGLRPAPVARAIDWRAVRDMAGGSIRALAATAAFLDLLPVLDEWTCVSLAKVAAITRYSGRKVGEAVQRAVECGLVDERRERGSSNLYRFAAAVVRGAAARAPVREAVGDIARAQPSPGLAAEVADTNAGVSSRPTPPAAPPMQLAATAATLMVGGVPLPLPPGARPLLEQDSEGRYWYRIGSMHFGPVDFG